MTQKEFFTVVASGTLTDEAITYASEWVARTAEDEAVKAESRAVLLSQIVDVIALNDNEPMTAKEIGQDLNQSTQRISYHLGLLVKEGKLEKIDGKPMQYKII